LEQIDGVGTIISSKPDFPAIVPESAPDPLQLKMSLIYLIPTPYNSQSLALMKLKGNYQRL